MKKYRIISLLIAFIILLIQFLSCSSPNNITNSDSDFSIEMSLSLEELVPESEKKEMPVLDENSTLTDYLTYAALNNPGLKAGFYRWKSALERIPQVTSLPDPRFTYAYFISKVITRAGEQEQKFRIEQTFPWFGKLRLQGERAFEQAETERLRFEAAQYRLFYDVKKAYYEYYYLGQSIAITQENIDIMSYLEEVARARLEYGMSTGMDVTKAQVELGKLTDRLTELRQMRAPLAAQLNEFLNLPPEMLLPIPRSIPEEHIQLSDPYLVELLRQVNPELKALEARIREAEKETELAQKNYFPDFTFSFEYITTDDNGVKESGRDAAVAGIMMNLPIWYKKYKAAEREAEKKRSAFEHDRTMRENSLIADLKLALFGFTDGQRRIKFYHDTLIPIAEHSLMMTQEAYQVETGSFLDVIDAQRTLLEFNLEYQRALTDRAIKLAEIEMLVGRRLP
jgi:cobalt-zinc-cadmium efflux system outer membrane protein